MRILLIVGLAVLLLGVSGCCFGSLCKSDCGDPYYAVEKGKMCNVCGGTGYYHGRCSCYETVWRNCPYCGN